MRASACFLKACISVMAVCSNIAISSSAIIHSLSNMRESHCKNNSFDGFERQNYLQLWVLWVDGMDKIAIIETSATWCSLPISLQSRYLTQLSEILAVELSAKCASTWCFPGDIKCNQRRKRLHVWCPNACSERMCATYHVCVMHVKKPPPKSWICSLRSIQLLHVRYG